MSKSQDKRVLIVGGGFAGINTAKQLGNKKGIQVTLLDKRNHHLFQPLLYQVAMAALSPADIAMPIRSVLSKYKNIDVLLETVESIDFATNTVKTDFSSHEFDYLVLACGASHSYFGKDEWEEFAPGLKSLEEATEIRRRVLTAYEDAERETNREAQNELLTFVVIGGGPTGVELAGALGEISRYTLSRDFRNIDPRRTRIILVEGGPRLLPTFHPELSNRAARDLEKIGVTIWTSRMVTEVKSNGITIGDETIKARTILWAAGVQPSELNKGLGSELDRAGRVLVQPDMSLPGRPNVFVLGDQACFVHTKDGKPIPGLAPAAIQQAKWTAKNIRSVIAGKPTKPFVYLDKGSMATIGRTAAVVETGKIRFGGFIAWLAWLFIHIFYLIGFRNRLVVFIQWAWSYITLGRGARLITNRSWRSHEKKST